MTRTGKYPDPLRYAAARLHRSLRRRQVAGLVSWDAVEAGALRPGCTALIGMCHQLPHVLIGNLACLSAHAGSALDEVIVVVDSVRGCLPEGLEARATAAAAPLRLRFLYYSDAQARSADRIRLPYLYAWLSWSIALAACETRTALLHDYDAFILDDTLARRLHGFTASGAAIEGIRWYASNGIRPEDRLATTFEAILDVAWLRSFPPVMLFNQVGRIGARRVDFDILLDIQANHLAPERRQIAPMGAGSLVHPSQMVHQFTMARRAPGAALPVFSLPMIPFLEWLGGVPAAIETATARITAARDRTLPFFDGLAVNFTELRTAEVDWCLKQMLQICEARGIDPGRPLHAYGAALYRLAETPPEDVWAGDFTPGQRRWIAATAGGDSLSPPW